MKPASTYYLTFLFVILCLLSSSCKTAKTIVIDDSTVTHTPTPELNIMVESSPTTIPTATLPPTPYPIDVPITTSQSPPKLSDQVFLFFGTAFGYFSVNPFDGTHKTITLNQFDITEPQPASANSLAFANHSNQVVVWLRNPDETGALWLGDIGLNNFKQIFEDLDGQFTTETSFPPQDVDLYWLPNDKYVLFKPTNEQVTPLLINVADLSYQEWPWQCNRIIISPNTANFALQCAEQDSLSTAIVEWDGLIWFQENEYQNDIVWQIPEGEYLNRDPFGFRMWSPDGSRIAYIDGANLEIVNNLGERNTIRFDVDYLYNGTIRWSDDGNRILISGQSEILTLPTWFVVNSETREILWTLDPLDKNEGYILPFGEISPLGNYVLLSSRSSMIPSGNSIWMYNVNENLEPVEISETGHGESAFSWGHWIGE